MLTKIKKFLILISLAILFILPQQVHATSGEAGNSHSSAILLLLFAVLLMAGKIGSIFEKIGLPAVLGELTAGITLSALAYFGVESLRTMPQQEVFKFLAELGAIILLFKIGLESNVAKLSKVGLKAILVATTGVVAPFLVGTYFLGPILFPEASSVTYMFIGASLVATSVGITASIFSDLKILKCVSCQTVLGAAVIDDVLGLFVLAIVTAIAEHGTVDINLITSLAIKTFGFLAGAIALGNILAKSVSYIFANINTNVGMKLSIAFSFALIYAYVASLAGLAPIIGAFCAGLVLDAVHFRSFSEPSFVKDLTAIKGLKGKIKEKVNRVIEKHSHTHVEDLIDTLGFVLVPIFFVFTGLQIDFGTLLNPKLYFYAFILGIAAILTKFIAGFVAQGTWNEKFLVGISMVPRGEVGLIFASVGKSLGVLPSEIFSVIVIVIVLTTFVAPPFISYFAKRMQKETRNFVITKTKLLTGLH
ncbi:MAG: cation:proton antiporter [Patescibacteria group bacterium]|nr:cation:proton antiporter [Patescibacteria group bacterium]